MKTSKNLISINQLAEHLGVQKSTIYGWVHMREIPHYKIGRLLKFRSDEIEEWIQGRRVDALQYE